MICNRGVKNILENDPCYDVDVVKQFSCKDNEDGFDASGMAALTF
jgi:hypothetical protein